MKTYSEDLHEKIVEALVEAIGVAISAVTVLGTPGAFSSTAGTARRSIAI
jgi:hypothetical protein